MVFSHCKAIIGETLGRGININKTNILFVTGIFPVTQGATENNTTSPKNWIMYPGGYRLNIAFNSFIPSLGIIYNNNNIT